MSTSASGLAQIGKSVFVKGELSGSEDLYVDGRVEGSIVNGDIATQRISIEEGAFLKGKVEINRTDSK